MTTVQLETPVVKRIKWARVVSDVLSPPAVWGALIIPVALQFSPSASEALFWALLYGVMVCLVPVLFIAYMVWMGKIGDMHMKERHERYMPMLVTIVSTTLGVLLLKLWGAPIALPLFAMVSLVQLLVMSLVTLYWQISMHAMGITGATVAISIVFSLQVALLTIPLIMLVGLARLVLKRHTPMQIFAGAMVGLFVPLALFLLVPQVLQAVL